MQEDKEQLFDAADTLEIVLAAMTGMVQDLEPVPERMAAVAGVGFSTATDLADWLVRSLGIPFREAHHITGRIVAEAERRGTTLEALPLDAMQSVEPRISPAVYDVLGVDNSVRSRTSFGGTSPDRVVEQVAWWRDRI
jgi:argininosuccinate lyase